MKTRVGTLHDAKPNPAFRSVPSHASLDAGHTDGEAPDGAVTSPGEFRERVDSHVLPDGEKPQPTAEAIPVGVIHTLIQQAHIPESDVREMSKDKAIARVGRFYATRK